MNGYPFGANVLVIESRPNLSLADWHRRYLQQAGWTSQQRTQIYERVALRKAARILDIGCGTGALEAELNNISTATPYSVDISLDSLLFASQMTSANWTNADAYHLPFTGQAFDVCLCHYLLLWLKNPVAALKEIKRVTAPGGHILILAEPDYAHRIDYPPELAEMGQLQRQALITQGANPDMGCSIGGIMEQADIRIIEVGVSGGQWTPITAEKDEPLEWDVLASDLNTLVPLSRVASWRQLENQARSAGTRILFTPVFYAIGQI